MLPSSTYAKTSALCRCGGTISPGDRTTLSIRPSFPGTSGSSLVIRGVSFATWEFALLPVDKFVKPSTNNRNNRILHVVFISFLPPPTSQPHNRVSVCNLQHDLAALVRRTSKHFVRNASFFQREHSSYVRN